MKFIFSSKTPGKFLAPLSVLIIIFLWAGQVWGNPEADIHFNKATAFSKGEKWEEAISEYKKALDLDSENTVAIANLGVAYSRINKHKEALLTYEKALVAGYDSALFRYFRGLSFAKLALLDEAVEEIRLALEMNSRLIEAKFDLGIIYQMQGRADLASTQRYHCETQCKRGTEGQKDWSH